MKTGEKNYMSCENGSGKTFLLPMVSFFAAGLIVSVIMLTLQSTAPEWGNNLQLRRIIQAVASLLQFGLPAVVYAVVAGGKLSDNLSFSDTPKGNWIYLLLSVAASVPVINFLAGLNLSIHLPESMQSLETALRESHRQAESSTATLLGAEHLPAFVTNIITIALIPAFVEEMFFRGWLQQSLARTVRPYAAIIITAIAFSALHMQPLAFIPRFAFGIIYGIILWRSGSLWLTVAAHFINNAAIVVIAYINRLSPDAVIDSSSPGTGASWPLAVAGLALLIFSLSRFKSSTGKE